MASMCRATVAWVVFKRRAAVSKRPLRCNSRKNRRSFQSNMNRPCSLPFGMLFKNAQQLRKN
ncbi:hypothetical protein D3C76_1349210 [compost metagenome]